MNAFVVRLPLNGRERDSNFDTERMQRLRACDWDAHVFANAAIGAVKGRAEVCLDGNWLVVGTALLTNRNTILKRLNTSYSDHDLEGQLNPSCSDMTLLATVVRRVGDAFPEWLCGAFSVVVLNIKAGTAKGYRDHFGQFPFYYCIEKGVLTCGSDLRAMLHLSGIPLAAEPQRIADFVNGREIDPVLTAFQGVSRLPAAHLLRCDGHEQAPVTSRYWEVSLPDVSPVASAAKVLRDHLRTATEAAFDAGHRVGAMLSGGLDSSTLVALAARAQTSHTPEGLPTFSLTYGPECAFDESTYIETITAAHQTLPHVERVTRAPDLSEITTVIEEQMDLFLGLGIQKSRQLYWLAKDSGIEVLIDGHGGDEVISHGYERLVELASTRRWWTLWVNLRGASRMYGTAYLGPYLVYIARYSGLRKGTLLRKALNRLGQKLAGQDLARLYPTKTLDVLNPQMSETLNLHNRYAKPRPPSDRRNHHNQARRAHLETVCNAASEQAFEVLYRSANAAGVTPHYPFFDRRVVEFCLSLPPEAKLQNGVTRWVLRETMRGLVPDSVRLRSDKADFTDEFVDSLRRFLTHHPLPDFEPLKEFLDVDRVHQLFARGVDTPAADIAMWRMFWRLIVLAFWWSSLRRWAEMQSKGELI